uniref:NADH dehydrogenase subunit 2 n=1 Tax=Coleonyx mitratus TaxID=449391 RepID=UPI002551D2BE|nr:NADH dehydrogenase subunit 2 [Coleonyx mitratus]WGC93724.1 NADH dehydrogenase subunit 2 [Coleonyx mitratus]
MNPIIWSLLMMSLATGTIITMSSHHWLLAWIGLEINTMAMIPIISNQHHPRATEAGTKYFLTQAAASALIMFSSITNAWTTNQWDITQLTNPQASMMLTLAIAMKLGLVPTHFWFPEVMQGTTIYTALIISTWQKLAPMTLLYMTSNHLHTTTLLTLSLLSTTFGGISGLNQTQTRKILAYSSIAHMGWLTMALLLNQNLTLLTMTLYIMMTTAMFFTLMTTLTKTIADMGTAWSYSPTTLSLTMLTLLSLGGLPPLTGFMPKLLILKNMVSSELTTSSIIIALSSLPSLFFYLRMAYFTTMTIPPTPTTISHKWRFPLTPKPLMPLMIMMSSLLLPLTPIIYNFTT